MEVVYLNELIFYFCITFGVLSSVFIFLDVLVNKKRLSLATRLLWSLFAFLLIWGPSFFLWIAYVLEYRDPNRRY
jgi:hypothetical protein